MVVIAVGAGIYLLQQASISPVDSSRLPTIQQALTTVPARDVPGHDVQGVPRPAGSTRSYFMESKAVLSLVYSQHDDLLDVRHALEARLADGGWKQVGNTGSGSSGGQPESARSWTEVYFLGDRILQVSMYRNSDVTATAYVVQVKAP